MIKLFVRGLAVIILLKAYGGAIFESAAIMFFVATLFIGVLALAYEAGRRIK